MGKTTTEMLWPDEWEGPWRVELAWDEIDGRVECVGLRINAADRPRRLTTSKLRELKLGRLVETEKARKATALANVARLLPAFASHRAPEELTEKWQQRKGRPPLYGPEHFERVAAVYQQAFRQGPPPTRAVAEEFQVQRSTAGKWVARARKAGLLGPTTKRVDRGVFDDANRDTKEEKER